MQYVLPDFHLAILHTQVYDLTTPRLAEVYK